MRIRSSQFYFYHLVREGSWEEPDTRGWMQLGQPAVVLFFMLTAYLFWRKVLEERENLDWKTYTVRRIFRLLPLYLFSVALIVLSTFALSHWSLQTGPADFVAALSKWASLTLFGHPELNGIKNTWQLDAGVTWTLRFETLVYIFLPILAFCVTKKKKTAAFVGLTLTLLLWHYARFSQDIDVGKKLLGFVGGILAAYISRQPRFVLLFKRPFFGLAALGLVVAIFTVAPRGYHPLTVIALTAIFIVAAVENPMLSVLRSETVGRLGRIGYSVYLLHGILLWWGTFWLRDHFNSKWTYIGFLVGASALLVTVSWTTYRLIEAPFIQVGVHLSPRRKRTG